MGNVKLSSIISVVAATLILAPPFSQESLATESVSISKRPAYQLLRQAEDWSVLSKREVVEDRDLFDPIKYIPLTDDEAIWLSLGGQLRERVEAWNHFNFGAPPGADDRDVFLLSRFLFHADLHISPALRLFVQGKSALSLDRDLQGGRRISDVDELDLQNGFLAIELPLFDLGGFVFQGGRQEMLFGKQRLVAPSDWTNTRRTFDGVSCIFNLRDWRVHGFWMRPVEVNKYDFNRNDARTEFFGVYTSGAVPGIEVGMDLYWLGLWRDQAEFNGTSGSEDRHTLGSRIWGKALNTFFDYEIEGALQIGEVGTADIWAFMITAQVGCSFSWAPGSPFAYVGVDYASGDDEEGDDEVGTFNKLFPTGHAHLGYIDIIGRQNIIDLRTGLSLKPVQKLDFAFDWHNFWRADDRDALYNPGGGVVRPGAAGLSEQIGHEIDLTLKYQLDRHTLIQSGYSHFFAGDFISESGSADDVDFVYILSQFTF